MFQTDNEDRKSQFFLMAMSIFLRILICGEQFSVINNEIVMQTCCHLNEGGKNQPKHPHQ